MTAANERPAAAGPERISVNMLIVHHVDRSTPNCNRVLRLAARGWRLFPVKSRDKQPLIRDWPHQATCDDLRLSDWLKEFPGCNWGLACGPDSKVFVLDVDGTPGHQRLEELERQGCQLPQTLRTRTGRPAGQHYFFQWPSNGTVLKNSAGKLGTGLDVRGDGGYIVIPPSIHPSGSAYAFIDEDIPIAPGPRWLLDMLTTTTQVDRPGQMTSGEVIPEGQRNQTLLSLAGSMRRRGMGRAAIEAALLAENKQRCVPPLNECEVGAIAGSVSRYEPAPAKAQAEGEGPRRPTLNDAALYGAVGQVVNAIYPHSEADKSALLLHFLAGYGSLIGRSAHCRVESTRHFTNIFFGCVGETAKGRKGTASNRVRDVLARIDAAWACERIQSGLSSGEGLIAAVAGAGDAAVDRRLCIVQPELANTLKVMGREGNTLSPVIREAWDSGSLRTLVKREPLHVEDAHVTIVGHITSDELRRYLNATEAGNGFANRFLWARSARSKCLPEGGRLSEQELNELADIVRPAVKFGRAAGLIVRDEAARELWATVYPELSEGQPGLLGAVTSRAEAQALRLSLIYALLDCSKEIRVPHLTAALALWDYCEKSARWIFGDALGDPVADAILSELHHAREAGRTRTQISALFGRHRAATGIEVALRFLRDKGLAHSENVGTDGRAAEVWFLTSVCETSELSERRVE